MQKKIFYLIILLTILSLPLLAQENDKTQEFGKLYTKADADMIHGPVLESVEFDVSHLKNFFEKAPEKIMFKLINKKLVLLGEKRNLLYSTGLATFTEDDAFTVYSTSKIKELLQKGSSDKIYFEKREKVQSITYDATTLEMGTVCPPYCGY